MFPMIHGRSCLALVLPAVLLLSAVALPAQAQPRGYRIALSHPFPPWGVGPLEGVDFDLLTAICRANEPMRCQIEDRPSSECVDTDDNGRMVIGPALASGAVDGCMPWFDTAERRQLGAEFSDGYSLGSVPQLVAADGDARFDGLGADGSLGGAEVGFIAGFFNDENCLAGHYMDFSGSFFSSEQSGRDEMLAELFAGQLDLVFWDSTGTVPPGTHLVGVPIEGCGPRLSMITFPPSRSRPHHADALRRDFECGLALIRASGEMAAICASSPHPGGDPMCVLDGPAPTEQCLADNPAAAARLQRSR